MKKVRILSFLATVAVGLFSMGMSAANAELSLNGASSYRDLGQEKFLAALYLELPNNSASAILSSTSAKRMEMRLTSNYSKRRWVNMWMQNIAISNNNSAFNKLAEPLVGMFNQQKGGLEPGDTVSIDFNGKNCSYAINGTVLASELPEGLFNLFVNAWIGKAPPSADFRNAILGEGVDTDALTAQLQQVVPKQERIDAIAQWLIDEAKLLAEKEAAEKKAAEEKAAAIAAAKAKKKAEEEAKALADSAIPTHIGVVAQQFAEPALAAATALDSARAFVLDQENLTDAQRQAILLPQQPIDEAQGDTFSVESVLALKDYIRAAKRDIYKSLRYPINAQRAGKQGQVRLNVEVDRDGNLLSVEASVNSEHKVLDRAAIKAVKKAAPYEPIPDAISDQVLSMTIPFKFKLE